MMLPIGEVGSYVAERAKRHGVAYTKTGNDAVASVTTRPTDEDAVPDQTEDLIVEGALE